MTEPHQEYRPQNPVKVLVGMYAVGAVLAPVALLVVLPAGQQPAIIMIAICVAIYAVPVAGIFVAAFFPRLLTSEPVLGIEPVTTRESFWGTLPGQPAPIMYKPENENSVGYFAFAAAQRADHSRISVLLRPWYQDTLFPSVDEARAFAMPYAGRPGTIYYFKLVPTFKFVDPTVSLKGRIVIGGWAIFIAVVLVAFGALANG